ncbi:MAG: accessory factor UbiK family protein [Alphaproteobacteria bacterium]|nr:accessory factor UbiK family protein [Alphaproteobacteria bacterium]MBU0793822.1 accessory factor UbiK family protein [Alphaproteobacteria bacterium]MBU0874396.1 accessory factor UbiK family protein [Alphaproteobacteria bacterium]MBU1768559.1 accessory factor UbiK family protein [Alphaproteobacteria bacterium]
MQSENRFFDDLSKIINGAAGTVAGVGREFESNARERAREWIGGLDFVSREEFEAVKTMAATAREQVEALEARLAALEGSAPVAKPAGKAKS